MKRTKCPVCRSKFTVVAARNTDFARYLEAKPKRKGGGKQLRKITSGSEYQMILRCFCRDDNKKKKTFSIVGRSKAQAITRLRIWVKRSQILIEKSNG